MEQWKKVAIYGVFCFVIGLGVGWWIGLSNRWVPVKVKFIEGPEQVKWCLSMDWGLHWECEPVARTK